MKTIATQNELYLALSQIDVDASLALCFIHGALDAQTIIAIRNAERICDYVVVVHLSQTVLSSVQCSLIQRAGGHYLYENNNEQTKCLLKAGVEGINATLILQSLITIMPLIVTVAENNTHLIKVLKNIQQTFGAFFTLQIKPTPINLLSVGQRQLRECLAPTLLYIQEGESDIETLMMSCTHALQKYGFKLQRLSFVDSDTLEEHIGVVAPTSLLLVEASIKGVMVKDILSLMEK